jgi:hypothetical protein
VGFLEAGRHRVAHGLHLIRGIVHFLCGFRLSGPARQLLMSCRVHPIDPKRSADQLTHVGGDMAEWTRGQLWDKIVEQAQKSPQYYDMLKSDPRSLMEKQLGTTIPPTVNIKVIEETADTYYIVLPAFQREGAELSDSDLEKVAGGKNESGGAGGTTTCTSEGSANIGTTIVDVKMSAV